MFDSLRFKFKNAVDKVVHVTDDFRVGKEEFKSGDVISANSEIADLMIKNGVAKQGVDPGYEERRTYIEIASFSGATTEQAGGTYIRQNLIGQHVVPKNVVIYVNDKIYELTAHNEVSDDDILSDKWYGAVTNVDSEGENPITLDFNLCDVGVLIGTNSIIVFTESPEEIIVSYGYYDTEMVPSDGLKNAVESLKYVDAFYIKVVDINYQEGTFAIDVTKAQIIQQYRKNPNTVFVLTGIPEDLGTCFTMASNPERYETGYPNYLLFKSARWHTSGVNIYVEMNTYSIQLNAPDGEGDSVQQINGTMSLLTD